MILKQARRIFISASVMLITLNYYPLVLVKINHGSDALNNNMSLVPNRVSCLDLFSLCTTRVQNCHKASLAFELLHGINFDLEG